jgi:hypothetical protein
MRTLKQYQLKSSSRMSMKIKVKIQLGDCGMGMPVIRTWQAMKKLAVGDILQMSSSHP